MGYVGGRTFSPSIADVGDIVVGGASASYLPSYLSLRSDGDDDVRRRGFVDVWF